MSRDIRPLSLLDPEARGGIQRKVALLFRRTCWSHAFRGGSVRKASRR